MGASLERSDPPPGSSPGDGRARSVAARAPVAGAYRERDRSDVPVVSEHWLRPMTEDPEHGPARRRLARRGADHAGRDRLGRRDGRREPHAS